MVRDFVKYSIWSLVAMLGATLLCFLLLRFLRLLEFVLGVVGEWGGNWAVATAFCFIFAPISGLAYLCHTRTGGTYFE